MAQANFEMEFRGKLFEKYSECQKYLIPWEVYYETIEDLKTITKVSTSKSRHQYYILKKYEVLTCGDVEKLIKKKKLPEDHSIYYATIEDTYDIISKAHIATGTVFMLHRMCMSYGINFFTNFFFLFLSSK